MTESFEEKEKHLFRERPDIGEIKNFVTDRELLGFDKEKPLEVKDVDPKSPSGHWNFLLRQEGKEFVFRLVGDEKPIKGNEIEREFAILSHVAPYKVAPQPFYFSKTEFKEPFLIEEFLKGELFTQLDEKEQATQIPAVVSLLAKTSNMPVTEEIRTQLQPINSYKKAIDTWQRRLAEIEKAGQYETQLDQIKACMPGAKAKLIALEPILESAPETFVFKSPHAGHGIKTADGFRFLNWGEAGYGDPSYALAVFLLSLGKKTENEKEAMIKTYTQNAKWKMDQGDFRKLLDGRSFERLVANTIWPVWMAANQRRPLYQREESAVAERLSAIKDSLGE